MKPDQKPVIASEVAEAQTLMDDAVRRAIALHFNAVAAPSLAAGKGWEQVVQDVSMVLATAFMAVVQTVTHGTAEERYAEAQGCMSRSFAGLMLADPAIVKPEAN